MHRGLGVYVSKVRSVTLDTWNTETLGLMKAVGVSASNEFWEEILPPDTKPKYVAQYYTEDCLCICVAYNLSLN